MPKGKGKARKLPEATRKAVKTIVRREISTGNPLHFLDYAVDDEECYSTAQFTKLTTYSQGGDEAYSRVGDTVDVRRMTCRLAVQRKSGGSSIDAVRLILFRWHPDDAADVPTAATDILQDASTQPIHSPTHLTAEKKSKFTVLWDRRFNIGGATTTTTTEDNLPRVIFTGFTIPDKKLSKIRFNTGGATTGSGHIYLMKLGSYPTGVLSSEIRGHITSWFRE